MTLGALPAEVEQSLERICNPTAITSSWADWGRPATNAYVVIKLEKNRIDWNPFELEEESLLIVGEIPITYR